MDNIKEKLNKPILKRGLIMDSKRIDVFFEKHIGVGIRWAKFVYQLELSVSIPFITIVIGIGKDHRPPPSGKS